jgi:D-serine deaminase-like pyridoxal phosphate-dependent protein
VLPDLDAFTSAGLQMIVMIDHEDHVRILEEYNGRAGRSTPWKAFVKVDVGSQRAGIGNSSARLDALIARANVSGDVEVYGFYCHAGHSYASRSATDAMRALEAEFDGVFDAARKLLDPKTELVLSIGATPTAHVVSGLDRALPANMRLELHAG